MKYFLVVIILIVITHFIFFFLSPLCYLRLYFPSVVAAAAFLSSWGKVSSFSWHWSLDLPDLPDLSVAPLICAGISEMPENFHFSGTVVVAGVLAAAMIGIAGTVVAAGISYGFCPVVME